MADSAGEEERGSRKRSGTQNLVVDDDFREMAKKAAWSVSSGKPGNGVLFLRDDNLDTYWQSDGGQPHLVNIQFQKKVKLQLLVLYVDFKIDESYTPSKIAIRAGDGFHNLKHHTLYHWCNTSTLLRHHHLPLFSRSQQQLCSPVHDGVQELSMWH